jgi:F-type H+-transporting ATPase subunit gamma
MANARDIRRRIKSVKNIQQITKAMEMVAAARLRRVQERARACRSYVDKFREVVENVVSHPQNEQHPLFADRSEEKILYFVVGADKGLAGAYNSNLLREALMRIRATGCAKLFVSGRKARDFLVRRGYTVHKSLFGISDKPSFDDAVKIADALMLAYEKGEFNQAYVIYTQFYSPMNHHPMTMKMLPLDLPGEGSGKKPVAEEMTEYIIEPSPRDVLDRLLPRYIETMVYFALLQSAASELGARMVAMGSATNNADDIISELVLNYNKVRQAAITREISEIVGGVEALQ